MDPLRWIDRELSQLESERLLRARPAALTRPGPRVELGGRSVLNLSSNDYLSLAGERASWTGTQGSSASRLIVGELEAHVSLEKQLAEWLGEEAALLFNSGYAANVGAVAALSGEGSVVVSDALNHASLIDGCRLGRGRVVVVPHRDVAAVRSALADARESRRLVVTDGYFSMDGDRAPLRELRSVCDDLDAALYVDEAHALGVWGDQGRGCAAAAGIRADVRMGTLGKSFGAGGAFVAGSHRLIQWLWNRARSFVFSTGLVPAVAGIARAALPEVRSGERTHRLHANVAAFRGALAQHGVQLSGASEGPIVPIVMGSADRVLQASRRLLERGILAQPIRPPTVPRETSRLRLALQSGHDPGELVQAAAVLAEVME